MGELIPVDYEYNKEDSFLEGERIYFKDQNDFKDRHLINNLLINFNNNAFLNPYSFSQTQLIRLFFWKLKYLEKDKNKIIDISHKNNTPKTTQMHYFAIIITNFYFICVLYDYYNLKYFNNTVF